MKRLGLLVLGLSAALTGVGVATAQEKAAGIPKVLQITREFVKPSKVGTAHEKTESAFVDAMRRAKWPTNYIAVTSLSGKARALFLTSYASFDAWQKDSDAVGKNATLAASLDRAQQVDGDLLESEDQGVFYFQEEMSFHPRPDLSQMRYLEVNVFHIKPGKEREWSEVVKAAKGGYEKGIPDAHWGMFEQVYGADGGTYLALTSHKSLDEIDKAFAQGKKFEEAMGDEGMKKLDQMFADCVESTQQQLFAVNPQMSYVNNDWIAADPDFWKPKAAAKAPAETKKSKPAAN